MLEKKFNEATETHSGLKISKKVVEGRPQSEIVKEAEENSFDLIVMGSRGLNELEEIVLGSVSDAVVNRSKVPVFIVK
jgi:nucleotide-binding universal stress UspA family protein